MTRMVPARRQGKTSRSKRDPHEVLLRGLIPQGRLYQTLRRAYRAANTTPVQRVPGRAPADEVAVERELSRRYLASLPQLEREFGLDLSRWRGTMEARISGSDGPGELSGARDEAGAMSRSDLHRA